MADINPEVKPELGEDGKPIQPDGEGGGQPPKIESEESEAGEAEPGEIPVRRSAAQHIINRQSETIKKLRNKDEEDEENDNEGEDDLTPEARGAVQKEVKKALDPVVQSLISETDENELGELIDGDPTAKKYEKRIRAYMKNPHYKGVPPSVIYHHLAFGDTEASEAADAEASEQGGGGRGIKPKGGTSGDVPSIEDQSEMNEEEFDKLHGKALGGEFTESKN